MPEPQVGEPGFGVAPEYRTQKPEVDLKSLPTGPNYGDTLNFTKVQKDPRYFGRPSLAAAARARRQAAPRPQAKRTTEK